MNLEYKDLVPLAVLENKKLFITNNEAYHGIKAINVSKVDNFENAVKSGKLAPERWDGLECGNDMYYNRGK